MTKRKLQNNPQEGYLGPFRSYPGNTKTLLKTKKIQHLEFFSIVVSDKCKDIFVFFFTICETMLT